MRRHVIAPALAALLVAGAAGTADAVTTGGHRASRAPDLMPIEYAPTATTNAASAIAARSATLNGTLSAPSAQDTYGFQYGRTTAYGHSVPVGGPDATLSKSGPQSVSEPVAGLTPGTTYHFRLVLQVVVYQGNVPQTTDYDGRDQTFTTPPVLSSLPPVVTTTSTTSTTATTSTATTTTATTSAPPANTTGQGSAVPAPAPVVGATADAGTVSGDVYVTPAGSSTPVALSAGESVPLDTVVDATHGVAEVTNALPGGATQSATVWAGRFTMTQSRSGHTTFHLIGGPSCTRGGQAHAARKRPVTLWAHDHHGRYSTQGQNSVATVRGTVWETIESCAGTRTVVRRGVVSVRDVRTRRTVLVRAGHSVLIPR